MDTTDRLALPLIAAGQAQKHVTHNDALTILDTVVQLSVLDADRSLPPASPGDGDTHIAGAGATGAWSAHAGEIARWAFGAWAFTAPREGWRAWCVEDAAMLVFREGGWSPLPQSGTADRFAVNTAIDPVNRLAVAGESTLLGHDGADHRLFVDKASPGATASLILQSNRSGRAEIGLVGSDALSLKVSADGSAWREAMVVEPGTGRIVFPATGFPGAFDNLLLNGDFSVNQRGFAGGALGNGAVGPDRWRALATGVSLTATPGGDVNLTGKVGQVVEPDQWGAGPLAGQTVTVGVDGLSGGSLTVAVAGVTGTVTPGPGTRSVTLDLPMAATGAVSVTLTGSGVSFRRARLVRGPDAAAAIRRPAAVELLLCQRYTQVIAMAEPGPISLAMAQTLTKWLCPILCEQRLRADPAVTWTGAARIYNAAGSHSTITAIGPWSRSGRLLTIACDIEASVGGGLGTLYAMIPPLRIVLDAEL